MSKLTQEDSDIRLPGVEEDLLILLVGQELYGLEILEAAKKAGNGKSFIRSGSLYSTLHKMEKKGLVQSWWGEETSEERDGARRRYYKATPHGAQILKAAERRRASLAQLNPAWGRI